jgi:putative nucleotidyltransferase with HDIG domain
MKREEALELLKQHITQENLIKHALAVEAAMREYAEKFNENPEEWGVVGLLHDIDYEKHPSEEEHPFVGARMLEKEGFPEDWVQAVLGHAPYTGVKRKTAMAKTLYAVDELTGFVTAVALVRPSKKLEDVQVKSVKKKFKDKAFARQVNREGIRQGAEELGVSLEDHIQTVLDALKKIAPQLGV